VLERCSQVKDNCVSAGSREQARKSKKPKCSAVVGVSESRVKGLKHAGMEKLPSDQVPAAVVAAHSAAALFKRAVPCDDM
jgi:hypothetical protein